MLEERSFPTPVLLHFTNHIKLFLRFFFFFFLVLAVDYMLLIYCSRPIFLVLQVIVGAVSSLYQCLTKVPSTQNSC